MIQHRSKQYIALLYPQSEKADLLQDIFNVQWKIWVGTFQTVWIVNTLYVRGFRLVCVCVWVFPFHFQFFFFLVGNTERHEYKMITDSDVLELCLKEHTLSLFLSLSTFWKCNDAYGQNPIEYKFSFHRKWENFAFGLWSGKAKSKEQFVCTNAIWCFVRNGRYRKRNDEIITSKRCNVFECTENVAGEKEGKDHLGKSECVRGKHVKSNINSSLWNG